MVGVQIRKLKLREVILQGHTASKAGLEPGFFGFRAYDLFTILCCLSNILIVMREIRGVHSWLR